jgi:PAS domain S-box-containing protein
MAEINDLSGIAVFDEHWGSAVAGALERLNRKHAVRSVCVSADAPRFNLIRTGAIDAAFYRKAEFAACLAIQMLHDFNHGSELTGHTPGVVNISGNVDTGLIIVTRKNIDSFDSEFKLDQGIRHHNLNQQLSLISSMIENVAELAVAVDSGGRIIYSNAASMEFCGYPKESLTGVNIAEIFDLTAKQRAQITMGLAEERSQNFESTALRKDGTRFPVHLSVSPLRSDTVARGVAIIATNMTDRNRSRQALIESHVRFLTVLDSIDADIYVTDMDTHEILLVNKHMRESFGDNLIGRKCYEALRKDSGPCSHCTSQQLFDSDGKPAGPGVWEDKNPVTGKWYINYDRAIKWTDGRFVRLQIATDISRIKDLEKESLRIQAQLQQAQKMEAIGTLAGGIAHDFNNILSAVIGYTEIVLADVAKGTPQHRNLREVLKAGYRARDLVNQILMFSRQKDKELKPIQVNQIVIEALQLLRASLPTTIRIEPNLSSNSAVMADPTQLHQVIMNLCTNAAHAMRERGGLLKIDLQDTLLDDGFIEEHPSLSAGAYVKLSVSDTGHGMEKTVADRIFDPFFTTKDRGEGTGMGLAVVLGIVKGHGGAIILDTRLNMGSAFDIYLPVIRDQADAESNENTNIPRGTGHILFVDDEKSLADLGFQILSRLGYDVTTRTSSVEALELFTVQPDKFDLVITDTTMPNMTGDELAAKLLDIRSDIPVILCTGYSERISAEKAQRIGIKEFVLKPIVMSELATTVRKVLDESR